MATPRSGGQLVGRPVAAGGGVTVSINGASRVGPASTATAATNSRRQRTDTACLQNNCAVLLLRRNQREATAVDDSNEFSEEEARGNALDAVRRFRRAIALTTTTSGSDGAEASETQAAVADDERGLAWYHRRLLAGERGGLGAAGGVGSHRHLHAPSGVDSHSSTPHHHHPPESFSFSHGDVSISSLHQSHRRLSLTPRKNSASSLNENDAAHATPASSGSSKSLYGCTGAAAVLGSPMGTTSNKLPLSVGSVGRSLAPLRQKMSLGAEPKVASEARQRRRNRSESFPAHVFGGGGSNRKDSNNVSTSFFGLPPAPPLFESNNVDAAKSLADTGNTISNGRRKDRSESFFLPSSTCGNSSFSCSAGGGGVLTSVSSSGTPSTPNHLLGRPRAKSFGISHLPPPPLNEELSIGSQNNNESSTSPAAVAAGVGVGEHQIRMQEYREIREKTRREAIVADVVHQTAYHAPVADEITPLGLEFMGDYISMVLPSKSGGFGGRQKGGEWAQAVRRGTAFVKSNDDEGELCIEDIAASSGINLAIVLYYGHVKAGDLDAESYGKKIANEDDEEEKKDASSHGQNDAERDIENEFGDTCDEDKRLELALALLQEAAEVSTSPVLRAVANLNAGVVMFRRNRVRDAFASFQRAKECVDNIEDDEAKREKHMDLPHPTYLRSSTLLNVATLAVRLGDLDTASSAATEMDGGGANASGSGAYRAPRGSFDGSGSRHQFTKPPPTHIRRRIRWLQSVSSYHVRSLIQRRRPTGSDSDSDTGDDGQGKPTNILDSYNTLLASARKELGHSHPVVGSILYHRGDALFDKQQLHPAMLSYLAALKVMESHTGTPDPTRRSDRLTYSRIWYGVARALHDREELTDALRAYQRTLELQTSLAGGSDVCVNVVQTLCNVGRVRHALGDVDGSLEVHRRVVRIAMALTGGRAGHPFVAARLRALGNLLVEAGRPAEAVQVYAQAARSTGDVCVGFQEEDVDGTENARQSARVLARAGLPDPCAATA